MAAFDCIVLGVGGFGSGALDALARRGANVLGIERFGVAHDRGSSHGLTRIIRKAYFEHPDYVPLCIRAYELWDNLAADSGRALYRLCGLLLAGPEQGEAVGGAKLAAAKYGVELESLTAGEAGRRFPGFRIPTEFSAVFEPQAGYLLVEECVRAHVERAQRQGAVLQTQEAVVGWTSDGKRVTVTTDRSQYTAAKLVITAGAWAANLLDESVPAQSRASRVGGNWRSLLRVVRKPQFWHEAGAEVYRVENGCPAYLFDRSDGVFYGFPCIDGRTLKVAEHSGGEAVGDPTLLDRAIHPSDTGPVARFLADHLPGVKPSPVRHSVCMYTLTRDRHFIVDVHPEFGNVVIGAGFSGHGFKFTTVLGEALADLALDGSTELPIGFLSLRRRMASEQR